MNGKIGRIPVRRERRGASPRTAEAATGRRRSER